MKKIIKCFIEAFLSYFAILIYSKLIYNDLSYNLILTSIFFLLYYFYYKFDFSFDKYIKQNSMIFSIIISLMLSIGSIVSNYIYHGAVKIFTISNIMYVVIAFAGLFILLYKIYGLFLKKSNRFKIMQKNVLFDKKKYFLVFSIITIAHSFAFIRFYPGIMTADSYAVIHYANNFILNDFHTFGHTWFFGIFFHLGKLLFHNLNCAVAFSMIIQMFCMSAIFTTAIKYFWNKGLNKNICILLTIFFAFSPLHVYYSITLWRDIMFGGSFVIILICLYEFVSCKDKIKPSYIMLFIIGVLIMLFFRNNGIYVYLFCIPFIIIIMKNKRIMMSILTISIACFYFIIKGPVFDYFNVEKTNSVEAFSIPLQQIARVVASGKKIDDKDEIYLRKLFRDYDSIPDEYLDYLSNPIKNLTNNDILINNKKAFLSTYINLLKKYPNIYVDAYLSQTIGYWYPDVVYWSVGGESNSNFESESEIHTSSLLPEWGNRIIDATLSKRVPLSSFIWSLGLQFIILLFSMFVLIYKKNYKYLLCYVPLFGLWLSMMAATPVFCELRYVYGLFTCAPFMLVLPFIINDTKEEKND